MDRIYNDLILIIKYSELIKSFCKNINTFLTKFYPNICKIDPTLVIRNSRKNDKTDSHGETSSDIAEVSDPHVKTDRLDLKRFYEYLQENKDAYCIWISKINRDHNINPTGKLATDGDIFKTLINKFNLKFSSKNGWATPIKKSKGNYYVVSIHRNGTVRAWINKNLSWELFLEHLKEDLKFLTINQFKEFIECLMTSENKQLFFLETANLIGPKDIIDRDFKDGCLVYKNVYHLGIYHPVLVKIDYSDREPEIEFQGSEAPTRKLQDITVRSFEVSQYLGHIEYLLDQNIDLNSYTYNNIKELKGTLLAKDDLLSELSEIQAKLFGLDIKDDVKKIINNENLKDLEANLRTVISAMKGDLELNRTSNYKDIVRLYDLIHTMGEIQRIIYESIEFKTENLLNELKESSDDHLRVSNKYKKDIYELLNSRERIISERLKEINNEITNQVTKKLNSLPDKLIEKLLSSKNKSKLSLIKQFNKRK